MMRFRNKCEDVAKEEIQRKGGKERWDGLSEFSASRQGLKEANERNKSKPEPRQALQQGAQEGQMGHDRA
jgi:hypothetical protein